ncbi:hypothetical protein [Cohnella fermenti]|uniref:Uncharacterized protein n=1 Tax=Cohnella fermenti TaxID=2565925 RepID=A0A4S4BRA4_9BACL|nr:hypothetical protein [Cohnella fermenti]THF76946.1 hypothetical protein E6C55_17955 [Cohnella fermenti]
MREGEKGSALLLTLFILIVFTMLGIAVIGATVGGAQRSMTREKDVQSLHLAEMALNEAVAQIAAYFDGKEDINEEEVGEYIREIESKINLSSTVGTSIDKAVGTIDGIKLVGTEEVGSGYGKNYTIKITSTADVDGVTRKLEQQVVLNSFPEFLQYAFGSEGNLYINGSPYILGNLYSGKKLYIKNEADYIYEDSEKTKRTVYPALRGSAYVQSPDSIQYCYVENAGASGCENDRPGDYRQIKLSDASGNKSVEEVLGIPESMIEIRSSKKFVEVNVEESFLDKLYEAAGIARGTVALGSDLKSGAEALIDSLSIPRMIKPAQPADPDEDEELEYQNALNDYYDQFRTDELTGSYVFPGDLAVTGEEYARLLYSAGSKNERGEEVGVYKSNWFIVEGDLAIDNQNEAEALDVRGNILVTGDVLIRGDVRMDATIFTLGETTIEDAAIEGLNGSELVLISKGPILINRVEAFNEITNPYDPEPTNTTQSPPVLNAFFYTDSSAELYGVGSAFWIRGGFFSKGDMVINAVLGNTDKGTDDLMFDARNELSTEELIDVSEKNSSLTALKRQSRFVIDYNSDVYSDQNVGLPRVRQINMAIGKKRFAD